MNPKQFINSLPTQKELCEKIAWDRSSMSQWLKGQRGIPEDKEEKLIKVLKKYGYKKTTS